MLLISITLGLEVAFTLVEDVLLLFLAVAVVFDYLLFMGSEIVLDVVAVWGAGATVVIGELPRLVYVLRFLGDAGC